MSDEITQRASIVQKYDELSRTSPMNKRFKERLSSLKGLINQYNHHIEERYRLVEVQQYPVKYKLVEVIL